MLCRVWLPPIGVSLLLAGCAEKAPLAPAPEPVVDPVAESVEAPPDPLTPEQGRALLQEAGVPYSQASFLSAAGGGDRTLVEAFVAAGMDPNVQNEDEGYDTALMRAGGPRPPGGGALPAQPGGQVQPPQRILRRPPGFS
ncbi:MAG: hypothetical protein OXN90_10590 [Gemmatimonadota bacterium]|nr:hypothetical protein [Gemmatimonadota bacterium]